VQVGDRLETVLIGCLVGDHLRIWRGDGHPEMLRVLEVDELAPLLARGAVARTSPESGCFRETALVNDGSHELTVFGRTFYRPEQESVSAPSKSVSFEPADEPEPSTELWISAAAWFGRAFLAAALRGEFIVVQLGGWDSIPNPYVSAYARRETGAWLSTVEAQPVPHSWPECDPTQPGAIRTAQASKKTVYYAGRLIADAAACWTPSPFDVVITFGTCPDGPWDEDSEGAASA
jgi:hypothetical protein